MKKSGFTLVELLVVVSIISLLSSVMIVTFQEVRKSAHDVERFQTGRAVENALEMYRLVYGDYPISEGSQFSEVYWEEFESFFNTYLVSTGFLNKVPRSPNGETYKLVRGEGFPPLFMVYLEKERNVPSHQSVFITFYHGAYLGNFGICLDIASILGTENLDVSHLLILLGLWGSSCEGLPNQSGWCVGEVGEDELNNLLSVWGSCLQFFQN
jgi:prepilin-type N-terminal cleavage/methylation domain-containing protein